MKEKFYMLRCSFRKALVRLLILNKKLENGLVEGLGGFSSEYAFSYVCLVAVLCVQIWRG